MPELIIDDGTANKKRLKICKRHGQRVLEGFLIVARCLRLDAYSLEEFRETLVHNSFHNLAVDISEPDGHHSSDDKQPSEQVDVARLFARPVWQHDFCQLGKSGPEFGVYVATTLSLFL